MSKAAKSRRSDARKSAKASRKAAKAALYHSYAEQGHKNRAKKHGGKSTEGGHKGQHLVADCGNPGCIRCYPDLNNTQKCNGEYRLPNHPVKRPRSKVLVAA
jgi:hypothetical protein